MTVTSGAAAHMWFVQTGGEVWGPYPEARIAAFVREGRVRRATLLSPFADGPWAPAADSAEFCAGFAPQAAAGPASLSPVAAAAASPLSPPRTAHLDRPRPSAPAQGPAARPLLVFATLASVAPSAFHAGLARLGPCVQVRPEVWLVRRAGGAAALRNLLSAHLGAEDGLLVVEAPLEHAAWFNLAPARDRELRRLWAGA